MGGVEVSGPADMRRALLADPERFVSTVVEKLMTYALWRGLAGRDMAAVREVLRDTADDEYRFSSIVLSIVESVPFRMRQVPQDDTRLRVAGRERDR
jgi:hypothetical protein